MVSERMRHAYDAIAARYADRYAAMPEVLADLGRKLLAELPEAPRILDAGCGAGRDMAWFESQGVRVTGIDLSPGMLEQARPHVAGPLLEMDMTSLTLPDRAFEGIWCMASLLHLPMHTAPGVIEEFSRVLNEDGCLVLGLQEGASEGWEPSIYDGTERYFARYAQEDVNEMLSGAGFAVVSSVRHQTRSRAWLHILARNGSQRAHDR